MNRLGRQIRPHRRRDDDYRAGDRADAVGRPLRGEWELDDGDDG